MPTVIAALPHAPTDLAPASKDDSFSCVHGPGIDDHRSQGRLGGDSAPAEPAGRDERERTSQLLCMTTTFGSVYYHHDGLGSTIAITNGNAEVLECYSYDVFGRVTIVDASTGNAIPQSAHGVRHFYTGHDFQAELGLYLTHYRAYEPALGRWLSADPIGEAGGINLYGYVSNNAVNYWDPLGLDWEYSQSRGTMTHIDSKGKRTEVAKGYSGAKGEHQNNPASQHLKEKGPIPRGQYEIGNPRESRNTGNHVMDLKPHPDNEMHGRDDFQIHGDNPKGDKSASKGCIILPLEARKKISSSGDKKLIVVK